MTDLPMVDWDRGLEWIFDDGLKAITIYGWIPREEDEYKDFVLIKVLEKEDVEEAEIHLEGTSSEKYSEEVFKRLFPDKDLEEHNECFRLEDKFDVPNLIRLGERGENR